MAPVLSTFAKARCARIHEDIVIAVGAYLIARTRMNRGRKRQWAVHPINQKRNDHGFHNNLALELNFDEQMFQKYFRLKLEEFAQLLFILCDEITKFHVSKEIICI